MQNSTIPRTEGIVSLERLQRGKYRVWTREEIESMQEKHQLSKTQTDVLLYIAKENSMQKTPSSRNIREKFNLGDNFYGFEKLKRMGMLFNFTIPEIVVFYGLEILGYLWSRGFDPVPPLEWLQPYLNSHESLLSWKRKIKDPRAPRYYPRLYVGLLELEDRKPCYSSLGLHILKSEIKIPAGKT